MFCFEVLVVIQWLLLTMSLFVVSFLAYNILLILMPISGPASFLPTMELFLSHWTEVDVVVGALTPLKVGQANPNGGAPVLKVRADLVTLKTDLTAARSAVTSESVNLAVKRGMVRDHMEAVLARYNQFASAVRGRYAGRAFERALPGAPSVGDSPETFLKAVEKAEALWGMITTALGATPLTLGAGTAGDPHYAVAQFTAELAVLRTAAQDIHKSEQKLTTLIEVRNDLQQVIAPLLRDYRQAVAGRFPEGHALVESLPRYSPEPGNKPAKAVLTSAMWNEAAAVADVAFTPSTSTDVVRHELRICAGPVFDEDLETIDAVLAVGQPPEFHTGSLLGTPGAIISLKIYAVTADGRESDSQALSVQRPSG